MIAERRRAIALSSPAYRVRSPAARSRDVDVGFQRDDGDEHLERFTGATVFCCDQHRARFSAPNERKRHAGPRATHTRDAFHASDATSSFGGAHREPPGTRAVGPSDISDMTDNTMALIRRAVKRVKRCPRPTMAPMNGGYERYRDSPYLIGSTASCGTARQCSLGHSGSHCSTHLPRRTPPRLDTVTLLWPALFSSFSFPSFLSFCRPTSRLAIGRI